MKASATALKEKYAAASRSQAAEEGEGEDVPGTPGTPAAGNPDPLERRQSGINSSVNSSLIIGKKLQCPCCFGPQLACRRRQ